MSQKYIFQEKSFASYLQAVLEAENPQFQIF